MDNMYIATVDRNTKRVDFSKFKDNNVVGVIIEAGQLYNSLHVKLSDFKSPKVKSQIEACIKAGLSYGFYFTARATNEQEVKEEVYELSFILRSYPTQLGLWMVIGFTKSKTTNDKLMDEYYKRLSQLGLVRQVGLYVTESQLKKITWSKHQDQWYLWLNKHYIKSSEFDDIITPSIFDVEVE